MGEFSSVLGLTVTESNLITSQLGPQQQEVFYKKSFKCLGCHKRMCTDNFVQLSDGFYCIDCYRSQNLGLECIFWKGPCWEASHQHKHGDRIENKPKLNKPLRRKTFVMEEDRNCSNKALSMENADKGVGALYVIIDTIRRKRAEQREIEEKQKQEEIFHNGVNKGRELLKPL